MKEAGWIGKAILVTTLAACVLLLACLVALGTAELLVAVGDAAGAAVLKYVCLGLGCLTVLDGLALLLLLAIDRILRQTLEE